MKRFPPIPAAAVAMLAASLSHGDARAEGDAILHEFVPNVDAAELFAIPEPTRSRGAEASPVDAPGSPSGDTPLPGAIQYEGELLAAPDLSAPPSAEPIASLRALPGDSMGREEAGRRSPSFRPDRITRLDGTVDYHVVFAPTVMPHKRGTALDRVAWSEDGVPVLRGPLAPPRPLRPGLRIAADASEARERFWGHVQLDFRDGTRVPLPSVSPEMRIINHQSEPGVSLVFERDSADNYFVSLAPSDAEVAPEIVQLAFLVEAPSGYWNRALPPPAGADAPRIDLWASRVSPLPEDLREEALSFAEETLGLTPASGYREALDALVRHFRSFEEGSGRLATRGTIYGDLARQMEGVCRHRAYAFTITALALGLPTRFIMNEAHAFVEVLLPDERYMRIDLGGAAAGLRERGVERPPRYTPRTPDPLPQPLAYRAATGNLGGSAADEGNGDPSSGAPSGSRGTREGDAPGDAQVGAPPSESGPMSRSTDELGDGGEGPDGAIGEGSSESASQSSGVEGGGPSVARGQRASVRVSLDERQLESARGGAFTVHGRARSGDASSAPAGGLRVELVLRGRFERLLGVTTTNEDGTFSAELVIPTDLAVGDYTIVARTPGDATRAASD